MQAFEAFVERLHTHLSTNPNTCVEKGIPAHLGDLPDPTLSHADEQVREAIALLGTLDDVRAGSVDFDEEIDLELAELLLKSEVFSLTHGFEGERALCRTPSAGRDIGDGIFLLLAQDDRPPLQRLDDMTARIEKVPEYLSALESRLEEPVERWVRMDLDRVAGLPSLFESVGQLAATTEGADPSRLEAAIPRAEQALSVYADSLRARPTTRKFHVGEAQAQRIVLLRGIEQSLATLHAWATEFLAETAETVEQLRRRLVRSLGLPSDTPAPEVHRVLSERHRLRVDGGNFKVVLDRYELELDRIVDFIKERELFEIPTDQRVRVLETPRFMLPSIPAGAMVSPPPFRGGVRTSLVYLTLSEALLDEHTEISIPSMIIHEAIPGHHLQLSEAGRHPSIVRKHFDAMDQAEGWTTMLEDYMLDVGYAAEHIDELRFVGKREIARIGARVGIDLFFMTGDRGYLDVGVDCDTGDDDPFAAAGNLLQTVTGFVPERVDAELGWYSQERGYPLCYLTGNRLVWQLRREVSAHLGEGPETDRRFHREFLAAGNMPLSTLRRVLQHRALIA